MAGIYIHIPFCKQACSYCNFHFSTRINQISEFVDLIIKEIELRKDFLRNQTVSTIYIGGGTPSLLSSDELKRIINICFKSFSVSEDLEITIEANPDDLNSAYIKDLKTTQINRFSIGIQSFYDIDLQFMNRAHNAAEAGKAIQLVQDVGFENISIDLIFGNPTTNNEMWMDNLTKAIALDVPHLSCYALTVEEQTALAHQLNKKLLDPINEEHMEYQFEQTIQRLSEHHYEHYEISNYALPGFRSQHNSNYWFNIPYLGIGPSAHSYDGQNRYQNIPNNQKYKTYITNSSPFIIEDHLTINDRYNELIMTRLRTIEGVSQQDIYQLGARYLDHFRSAVRVFIKNQSIIYRSEKYILTKKGKLFADRISAELFITE